MGLRHDNPRPYRNASGQLEEKVTRVEPELYYMWRFISLNASLGVSLLTKENRNQIDWNRR